MNLFKLAGLLILGIYGILGAFKPEYFSLINGVNLLFHEAGHQFLMPFGEYLHIWGGTLFQLLFPFGIGIAFLIKREPASASVMFWWSAQNLFPISAYIKDARAQVLPYVGGEIHDWGYILSYHHWLGYDQWIGNSVWCVGILGTLSAITFGIFASKMRVLEKPTSPLF